MNDRVNEGRLTKPYIYDANRTDADELTELSVQLETNGPIIKPYENRTNVVDSPSLCGVSNPSAKPPQTTYFREIDQQFTNPVLIFIQVCSGGVPDDSIVQNKPYGVVKAREISYKYQLMISRIMYLMYRVAN